MHWLFLLMAIGCMFMAVRTTSMPLMVVLMLVSLYWITGIPFVEAQALRSRGEDYRDYQRSTSAFVPWFPKRSAS